MTSVDEVTLDMIVRNKKSKTVLDLQPTDISVTDGGKVVTVSDLRLVSGSDGDHLVTLFFDRCSLGSSPPTSSVRQWVTPIALVAAAFVGDSWDLD